jgi:glutathione peroxidase
LPLVQSGDRSGREAVSIYDFEVTTIDGATQTLEAYRDKVLLIVNVASQCGFTGQYAGLQELYERHQNNGLVVLGFPCNQFGQQEPGDEAAIKTFCSRYYNVTFPMFRKIEVNGKLAHPLFVFLKSARRGSFFTKSIKWNFTKFLVGRNGDVLKRFGPAASPARIEKSIVPLLDQTN